MDATLSQVLTFAGESIFVTVILGSTAAWIAKRIDGRRALSELRKTLASRMMEVVYPFYCQLGECADRISHGEPEALAPNIHDAYRAFRVDAAVVQTNLETYFRCDIQKHTAYVKGEDKLPGNKYYSNVRDRGQPWTLWHSVRDLLIIDYKNLARSPVDCLRTVDDYYSHTGLTLLNFERAIGRAAKHETVTALFEVRLMEAIRKRYRRQALQST